MDHVWQSAIVVSVVRPRWSCKTFSKVRIASKKMMITVWWSKAKLIHYNFLNPGKTITSKRYYKLTKWIRNCSVYIRDWSIEGVQFFSRLNELDYEIIPHSPYIHLISRQPITIFSNTSTTSWNKNASLQKMMQKTPSRNP